MFCVEKQKEKDTHCYKAILKGISVIEGEKKPFHALVIWLSGIEPSTYKT